MAFATSNCFRVRICVLALIIGVGGNAQTFPFVEDLSSVLVEDVEPSTSVLWSDYDDDGHIEIGVSIKDNSAVVSIADWGEGMTSEFIRERLFRPFDSTKESHAMGIGAYQARNYIRSLGGQLTVASEVGAGTLFSVHSPLHD